MNEIEAVYIAEKSMHMFSGDGDEDTDNRFCKLCGQYLTSDLHFRFEPSHRSQVLDFAERIHYKTETFADALDHLDNLTIRKG